MSRFIKYKPDSEMSKFLESKPNANHLAQIIAKRARRTKCELTGLEIGQCLLGDFKRIGLTEKQYRVAKNTLKKIKFAAFQGTNKGTVATLVSIDVWDINAEDKGGRQDTTGATNKNVKKTTTTSEQDFKEPKPYGIDEAREGIERLFGNTQVQVKNIQKAFKEQTGFELDSGKALQGIVTFLQKGMEETYKGRIKDDEKLRSYLLRWITNQKKFDYVDSVIKVQKKQDDNFITLENHLEKYCKPKEIERFKKMGKYDIWLKKFETETFKFKNLAKVYSNPNITAAFLFELCFLPYGRNIGGTKPEAKLKSFKRFFEEQSNYNQNKGEMRSLFKNWSKANA